MAQQASALRGSHGWVAQMIAHRQQKYRRKVIPLPVVKAEPKKVEEKV